MKADYKKDWRPALTRAIALAQESGAHLGDVYNYFSEQWGEVKQSRQMSWEKAHRRKPNGYWNDLLLAIPDGGHIFFDLSATHTKYDCLRSVLHDFSKTGWLLSCEKVSGTIVKITHYASR